MVMHIYISRKFTDIWSKTNQILGDVMTKITELLEIFEKKHLHYPMKLNIWHLYVKYSDLPDKVNECWKQYLESRPLQKHSKSNAL